MVEDLASSEGILRCEALQWDTSPRRRSVVLAFPTASSRERKGANYGIGEPSLAERPTGATTLSFFIKKENRARQAMNGYEVVL